MADFISLPMTARSLAIARVSASCGDLEKLYSMRVPPGSITEAKPARKPGSAKMKFVSSLNLPITNWGEPLLIYRCFYTAIWHHCIPESEDHDIYAHCRMCTAIWHLCIPESEDCQPGDIGAPPKQRLLCLLLAGVTACQRREGKVTNSIHASSASSAHLSRSRSRLALSVCISSYNCCTIT